MGEDLKVGVLGAGMMGAEIALCFAAIGCEVILMDTSIDLVKAAKNRLSIVLDKAIKKEKFEADNKEKTLNLISPVENFSSMHDANLIVEAVVEKIDVKKEVFLKIDKICAADCILASNTSSIPITEIAAFVSTKRAQNIIGMHFFSPAYIMKLVEVIPGYLTSKATLNRAKKVLKSIGKTPIEVKDVSGFAVNRLLNSFFIEAIRLLEEGVATKEDIDTACKLGLGHPVGPFELLDLTGLDLNLNVHEVLFNEYGDRFRPRPLLKRMVAAGLYGRKSKVGFYKYNKK